MTEVTLTTQQVQWAANNEVIEELIEKAKEYNTPTTIRVLGTNGYVLEDVAGEEEGEYYYNPHLCSFIAQPKLTDVEQEISLTRGEAFINDEYRSLDERGIKVSILDTERRIDTNKKMLEELRNCWICCHEIGHKNKKLLWSLKGTGMALAKRIANDEKKMDQKLGTQEVNDIMKDILPKAVKDSDTIKWDKDVPLEEVRSSDYNKAHWNGADKHWTNVILKVNAMIKCRKHTAKNVAMFRGLYAKLWKEQRAKKQISYRQFAELRYMIASTLWERTDDIYWAEKADADLLKMEKALGSANTCGNNIPETFVSIDDMNIDDQTRMTGTIGAPNEDRMIDMMDRKYISSSFQEKYPMLPDFVLREFWNDYLAINKTAVARKDYTLPTGANAVLISDAAYAMIRNESRDDAAKELGISVSTLARRLKMAKDAISASSIVSHETAHELISLL